MPLFLPRIERLKPLLGTFVRIRVEGLEEGRAHRAINDAFAEVERVHALMSFHEPESDVARLNRYGAREPVTVSDETFLVLARALDFARESDGVFDPTVASVLVSWGLLPRPEGAPDADSGASWRDIVLLSRRRIRFGRPLWIDLGGIAKGYAVDRAAERLIALGPPQGCVNAGGDLRIFGRLAERVALAPEGKIGDSVPVVEIEAASLASSSGHVRRRHSGGRIVGPHIDGRTAKAPTTQRFVSVAAARCIDADALTKIVMTLGKAAVPLLRRIAARAWMLDPGTEWRELGTPDPVR